MNWKPYGGMPVSSSPTPPQKKREKELMVVTAFELGLA
jgi:hypothetical protein